MNGHDSAIPINDDGITGIGRAANAAGIALSGAFTAAYGDGSVRRISTAADPVVRGHVANRADGQVVKRP